MMFLSSFIPTPTRAAVAVWLVILSLAAILVGSGLSRLSTATSAAHQAQRSADKARLAAQEIVDLRSRAPAWLSARREEEKLSPRLVAALTAVGLPAQTLSSFSLQRESNLGGKDVRAARERATCTLSGITLPQLGAFVDTWRSREPSWIVTGIDIVPINERGLASTSTGGADIPLRIVCTLESLFVVE